MCATVCLVLQGIKWLKAQEEARLASMGDDKRRLHVMQLGQKKWMSVVTNAITQGHSVVIENVGESIDAVLDPVLSRAVFRKGKNLFIKMGGEDVEYDTNFKLFLQVRATVDRPLNVQFDIQAATQTSNKGVCIGMRV